jgi:type I restriction enzyme M protein
MNMFLHGMDSARIEWCDTINSPRLIEDDGLMRFDIVVANPPFSLDKWGSENAEKDRFNRFFRGIPPKGRGDFAFISHMIETAIERTGTVAVITPHGVLFRGGNEGRIRRHLVEENLLETVIGLPPNLFFGTGIPTAVLVFSRGKKTTDTMFIDASREFATGPNQNQLRSDDIDKIVKTHRAFASVAGYAHRATVQEIKEKSFNLNISRYVDTFVEKPVGDIGVLLGQIETLEDELATIRTNLSHFLKESGYAKV